MKETPFTQRHIALGAKMADFAGYNMPISYSGIKEEHQTVRENAGVFDVSHMGEFLVKGPKALTLIQKVSSNDASKIVEGQAQYTCFPTEKGGIVDDFIVYCLQQNEEYLLVVNASNIEKDWAWINQHNEGIGAELENISDKIGLLAIQGPKAIEYMQELTDVPLDEIKFYHFVVGTFAGVEKVIISATGYTGSGGLEIYFEDKGHQADRIWEEVFRVGEPKGMKPIGLGARDTLRLEKGFCLYGNDIDEHTSPLEAGLGWITKLKKGDFIGQAVLAAQKEQGISRRLVGLEMIDRGIPRQHYPIEDLEGNEIGQVTSGTMAPSLDKAIALGYLNKPFDKEGTEIAIVVRNRKLKAKVVKLPFLK